MSGSVDQALSTYEAIYLSGWHHPGVAWLANGALALWLLVARPAGPLRRILWALAALISLDALFTGALSPLQAGTPLQTRVSLFFVVAGDARFFLLVALATTTAHSLRCRPWQPWVAAVGLGLIVPLAQAALIAAMPDLFAESRLIFLVYEVLFVGLAVLMRVGWLPIIRPRLSPAIAGWVAGLCVFEIVQYAGWAAADVIIRAGHDAGHLARVAPNALYYGGLLWWAASSAPAEAWQTLGRSGRRA
jgi:hypothetical protein